MDMPTGFTVAVQDGDDSFNRFVWRCAHGIGYLIELRDEGLDAAVPLEVKLDPYYKERAEETKEKLEQIRALSDAEAQRQADRAYAEEVKYRDERKNWRESETAKRYNDMIAKVEAWKLPTDDHKGLKDFMLQQLKDSVQFDCHPHYMPAEPVLETGAEWKARELKWAEESHKTAIERYRTQVHAVEKANVWLKALVESVGMPEKVRP